MRIFIIKKPNVKKISVILFWLAVWQLGALAVSNSIVLVGPVQVISTFFKDLLTFEFWKVVFSSLTKIGVGFLIALMLGLLLGTLSNSFDLIKELLAPPISTLKSIPVASFVVLLLLWAGSEYLALFVVILIVFPNIYIGTLKGLENADKKLLEMAKIFEVSAFCKAIYIYRPAMKNSLYTSLGVSLGMAWKSGVAAEVIGLPEFSLGSKIYMAKVYLDTAELLSWTLTVILISYVFEKAVLYLLTKFFGADFSIKRAKTKLKSVRSGLTENDIFVQYDEQVVLNHVDISLAAGSITCLMGQSGCGKTTLINELIRRHEKDLSVVFQEDRLIEETDVLTNILLGASNISKEECRQIAGKLLPGESLSKKITELSGGMKRRVALLRALLRESEFILLDEPFNGLDYETRCKAMDVIREYQDGRTVLLVTHNEEDAKKLGASIIEL